MGVENIIQSKFLFYDEYFFYPYYFFKGDNSTPTVCLGRRQRIPFWNSNYFPHFATKPI